MAETRIYSVSELNELIKELFDETPLFLQIAVRGELSNYKIYPSGHHYFTLKDSESSLKCVMFKSSALKLRFKPENGMSVTAFGRVSVYPRDGAYQLYCTGIMPEGTGDLQVAFEQLKKKLDEEGLFDASHKKPLPLYPEKIAVITSSAGAAVHDMIRILSHRWPMTKVLLLPVRVQGSEAPAEIAGAIRYANRHALADLIITGRGGGSIEDLWAFNDERVARAIYASSIPVISAVGHEPDVTISDYVADRRASTPSNAAEIAVPDASEERTALESYGIRASQAIDKQVKHLRTELKSLSTRRVRLARCCNAALPRQSGIVLFRQHQTPAVNLTTALSPSMRGRRNPSMCLLSLPKRLLAGCNTKTDHLSERRKSRRLSKVQRICASGNGRGLCVCRHPPA